jgi:hypothetical protein
MGRTFGPLCQLVRAGFEGDTARAASCALTIAEAILFGARDRSRDKILRSLYDQQRRVDALRQPRPARPRPNKPAPAARAPRAKAA